MDVSARSRVQLEVPAVAVNLSLNLVDFRDPRREARAGFCETAGLSVLLTAGIEKIFPEAILYV